MKKKLLPLLLVQAVLSIGLSPAFGQSVWDEISTLDFTIGHNGFYGYVTAFTSPQANVAWVTYQQGATGGVAREPIAFATTDNWQTAIQGTVSPVTSGPYSNTFVDVAALDGQTAWLCGTSKDRTTLASIPTLWKTSTGVQGFTTLSTTFPRAFSKIHFFTATIGVAVCNVPAGGTAWPIYRTIDAGLTWSPVVNPPTFAAGATRYTSFKHNAGNSFWLTTSAGSTLYTLDAGLTWQENPNIGIVAFEDALHGLGTQLEEMPRPGTVSSQQLFRTADGGVTWTNVGSSNLPVIATMAAIPGLPGTYMSIGSALAAPVNGQLDVTTAITRNQGLNWQVISTDQGYYFELFASSPSQIWVRGAGDTPVNYPSRLLSRFTGTVLGTRQPQDPALQAVAYPNPTNGKLHLTGPMQGEEMVHVYDAAGRQCYTGKVSESQRTVDLSAQRAGLYQLLLTSANGSTRSLKVSKTE